MLNTKTAIAFAIATSISLAATASAAEIQRWSVQLADDAAVLRVSKNTEHKFVTATITSLQKAGTEKFALRVLDPKDETAITKSAYSISITDGVAQITATADLPHKVLVSLISELNDTGITKIKFAVTKNSDGAPSSQQ